MPEMPVPSSRSSLAALDAMQAIFRRLGAERDLEQLTAAAVREAATYFGVERCDVSFYDPENRDTVRPADSFLIARLEAPDALLAPVQTEGQVIGELRIANKLDGSPFTEEEIHLLGFFAGQLGLLIHSLRLLEQEQSARRLAETLLKVPQVVHRPVSPVLEVEPEQSGENLQEVLTRLLSLLSTVISYSSATVSLVDGGSVRIIAGSGHSISSEIIGCAWPINADAKLEEIIRSGRPLRIQDTHQHPHWMGFEDSDRIRSWIGAPIWASGSARRDLTNLIGVLNVDADVANAFSARDEAVTQTFADQMAVVLENQRLYAGIARRAAELSALRQTSLAVTAHRDVDALLQTIVEHAVALLQAQGGDIGQVDEARGVVRVVAEYNIHPSIYGDTVRLGEGLAGLTAQSGQPQLVADYDTWPRRIALSTIHHYGALVAVPLRWQERVLGVLTVFAGETGRIFSQDDISLLSLFADQAAIALANAQAYSKAKAQAALLSQLLEARNRLRLQLTPGETAQAVSKIVQDLLGWSHVSVWCNGHGAREVVSSESDDGATAPDSVEIRPLPDFRRPEFQVSRSYFLDSRLGQPPDGPIAPLDQRPPGEWQPGDRLIVPMQAGGREVGHISVRDPISRLKPQRSDIEALEIFAGQAAIALENARLFEQTQHHLRQVEQRSQQLALVNRSSVRLSASLDLGDVLRNAVTELANALQVRQAGLVLFSWDRGFGRLVAEYQERPDETGQDTLIPVEGNLSLARVLETRLPLAIQDAQDDPLLVNVRDVMARRGVKSILILPLIVRGGVIGTIGLDELDRKRKFSEAEIELAQTITNQAAAAIANAQLYEDVKRRAIQLQTIQQVTTRASTILDPRLLLMEVANLIAERCGYSHVHVLIVSPGEYLVAMGGSGPTGQQLVAEEFRLRIGSEGICGWVAASGQVGLVNDVQRDPRYVPGPYSAGTRSELAVPIKLGGQVLGVLDVQSNSPAAFDETDCYLIETLADQVAVALENARLYETLQERARQLAAAYEDLKALDRMKDEFVQTVSHELRTPLTFVKGYVELLLEGVLGELNPDQNNALQIVAQRTEGVVRLVSDIISLSRADSLELRVERVQLADIAQASIQGAEAVTEQAGIDMCFEAPADLPFVAADMQRLTQVFDNLIGNAIKFSPNGGKIRVRLSAGDAMVRAEISDQGIGIPAEELNRVWERFYQVDATTTRRFGGTGLGLAIVKKLIEAHGGEVGVSSTVGQGSTFFFTVPQWDARKELKELMGNNE